MTAGAARVALSGLLAAAAATAAIVIGSNTLTRPYGSGDAVLRLAWSARPERVERCEPQSEEVLAKLPAHMRQAVICEGTTAAYRLEVRRNGTVVVDQIVRGGGLRHDRAVYVFRDISVPAGEARVEVRFSRIDAIPARDPGPDAGALPVGMALPASLALEQTMRFAPRQVALVTYDADRRALVTIDALRQ